MNTCSTSVIDKRAFGKAVGNELIRRHGKRTNYMPKQIERAVERAGFPVDVSCWAMSLYSSRKNFDEHHAATGEVCDYAAMKSEMTAAMTDGASNSWFNIDMSWLEWPDIDLSSIFDVIDFSP
jgi:hypothetical protein